MALANEIIGNMDLSLLRWRLDCRLGSGARHALRRAAHIYTGPMAPRDFRIHPAQYHGAAVERHHFAILRAAGITGWTDIILAVGRSFELQFLELGAVSEIHHDATTRAARDLDRLAALAARRRRCARVILLLVKGAVAPPADDLFRTVLRWNCRLCHWRWSRCLLQGRGIRSTGGERERGQGRDQGRDGANMQTQRAHENLPRQAR